MMEFVAPLPRSVWHPGAWRRKAWERVDREIGSHGRPLGRGLLLRCAHPLGHGGIPVLQPGLRRSATIPPAGAGAQAPAGRSAAPAIRD